MCYNTREENKKINYWKIGVIVIYEKTPDSELMPRSTVEVYSKSVEVSPYRKYF